MQVNVITPIRKVYTLAPDRTTRIYFWSDFPHRSTAPARVPNWTPRAALSFSLTLQVSYLNDTVVVDGGVGAANIASAVHGQRCASWGYSAANFKARWRTAALIPWW